MIDLVFPAPLLSDLLLALRSGEKETAAIVLARPIYFEDHNSWRLLVQEINVPPEMDYEIRSTTEVQLAGTYQVDLENRARMNKWSVVYCHSHPFAHGIPSFSTKDDRTEAELASYLGARVPDIPHFSLLVGADAIRCPFFGI